MENHLLLFACLCLYPKYEGGKADVPNLIRCPYQTSPFQNSMTGSWFSHVTSPLLRTTNVKASKTSRFQSFLSPSLTIASYLALCSIFSRSFFILRNWEIHCSKVTKTNDTPPKKHILLDAFNVTTKSSKIEPRASLVAQWLRVCLPMEGTRVRALVWEDPTCRGATTPVSHNYWACASGACAPQQERPR